MTTPSPSGAFWTVQTPPVDDGFWESQTPPSPVGFWTPVVGSLLDINFILDESRLG